MRANHQNPRERTTSPRGPNSKASAPTTGRQAESTDPGKNPNPLPQQLIPYTIPSTLNPFFQSLNGLFTNSHQIPSPPNLFIYRHDVQIDTPKKRLRKDIISKFLHNILKFSPLALDPDNCVSDGSFIFTTGVPLPEEGIREACKEGIHIGASEYQVSISNTTQLSMSNPDHWRSIGHAYNVAFGVAMDRSGMHRIGRGYILHNPMSDLNFGDLASQILVLPGFFTEVSFKLLAGKPTITLIVDPMSKVLSKSTVLDKLRSIEEKSNRKLKETIEMELQGKNIMTKYDYQSYTIEDIDFTKTPMSTFHLDKEDKDITFIDYYKAKDVVIQSTDQPLIKVTSRKKAIYLVPELCLFTEMTPKVERDIPKVCSIKPRERVLRMSTLLDLLEAKANSKNLLTKFSISPQKTPIQMLKSSVTKLPKIQVIGSAAFSPAEGGWGPQTKGLKYGKSLQADLKILVTLEEENKGYLAVIETIKKDLMAKNAVSHVYVKSVVVGHDYHSIAITPDIKNTLRTTGLWIAILGPRNNKAKYEDVKSTCLREQIKSQCIAAEKLRTPKSYIIANIMKQIINKLGHLCWTVDLTISCPSIPNETLFVGIDVYHAPKIFSKGKFSRRPSIVGFVGVLYKNGSYQFFNDVVTLEGGKELHGQRDNPEEKTDYLNKFLKRIVHEYRVTPKQVIVYRDGVGDGQMEIVRNTEVPQVRTAFPKAALDFVVVKKRIHNKFIVAKGGEFYNPANGTVVNDLHNVGEEEAFYLISTTSNISTVKPVHYVFLLKQSKIPMAEFQNLTFSLCHLYPNWPDAIKLPLPTQLAHKLAWQVGECVKPDPKISTQVTVGPSLFKTMHYL